MTDTATHDTMRDPVCGMTLDATTAVTSTEHDGTTYHFCSEDCYRTFTADPETYAKG